MVLRKQLKKEGIPNPQREPRKQPKPRLTRKEKMAQKASKRLDARIRKIYLFDKKLKNPEKERKKIIDLMKSGLSDTQIKKVLGYDFKKK